MICIYCTAEELAETMTVKDEELNDLYQKVLTATGGLVRVKSIVVTNRSFFRCKVTTKTYYSVYLMNSLTDMEVQLGNFYCNSGSSINTIVNKDTMCNYLMGILHGFSFKNSGDKKW